ncbi:MAG: gamma-butyrobetaine hydroxylase-like domain-containing protein [Phycisphaerales bacterium JB040]
MDATPLDLDLKRDEGLTIRWSDGVTSYYPIAYLRRLSPSADMRELRKAMQHNPLTVLPGGAGSGGISATGAELVGNYALKIAFSDGHASGIYTWGYLREIDPAKQADGADTTSAPGDDRPSHGNPLGL